MLTSLAKRLYKVKFINNYIYSSHMHINFENITPLFESYFKYKNGGIAPNQEILDLFNEAINIE